MSRVAVVTGGASGMGLASARRLAAQGHRVALLDLDGDAATEAAADDRRAGRGRDRDRGRRQRPRRRSTPRWRRCAPSSGRSRSSSRARASTEFESFTDITPEAWARMIEVNLTGTFHCIQSAIPDMIAAGWGRIVTISSSSAQSGANRMAHYVASKGGVVGLTKALAVEYAPNGITVNTIPPGFIDTPMARARRGAR